MKKFLLGVLFTLVVSSVSNYTWLNHIGEDTFVSKAARFVKVKVIDGEYVLDPLLGLCKDRMGKNGFGWVFNVADYYDCDRFQRLLNWNFKKPNPNSPKY